MVTDAAGRRRNLDFTCCKIVSLLLLCSILLVKPCASSSRGADSRLVFGIGRGGEGGEKGRQPQRRRRQRQRRKRVTTNDPFQLLALAVNDDVKKDNGNYDGNSDDLKDTLRRLASAQQTFKGLDGAAHEAYRRTHGSSGDDITDTSVSGRAQRSAERIAATAEGLFGCELIELVQSESTDTGTGTSEGDGNDFSETIQGREVLLNITSESGQLVLGASAALSVLVLYEKDYDGGSGLDHGTMSSMTELESNRNGSRRSNNSQKQRKSSKKKGRLLIIIGDEISNDFIETMEVLKQRPKRIKLQSGLVTDEVASVQPTLYKVAGKLLQLIEPYIRAKDDTTAIHFVGSSLSGGVASLAATMLDGAIPMPKIKTSKGKKKMTTASAATMKSLNSDNGGGSRDDKKFNNDGDDDDVGTEKKTFDDSADTTNGEEEEEEKTSVKPLSGLGRARSSALSIGAPPCFSSNVLAAYCTSIMYGDDVICRTTSDSIQRLLERIRRHINGGFIGRNMGWMSDTVSLTMSSIRTHAHGSEGEEIRLAIPGRAYLVRPRRLGGICSIHEVGNLKKGGREALRANILWQLNDILLSSSMWKHHSLESYIHGLDRIQLRGASVDYD